MKERDKLLMVCYYFPPIKSIACVRTGNFCHQASKYFSEVHVVSTRNCKKLPNDTYPDTNYSLKTNIPTLDIRSLFPKPSLKSARGKVKGAGFIYKLLNSFPFNFMFGIGGFIYILIGFIKCSRLINKKEITHLFSSYYPYADHYICWLLKLRFPKLIWIADFRDLQVTPLEPEVLFPNFQNRVNHFFLRKASMVTTVSKGLKKSLDKLHHHVVVLHNGIDQRFVQGVLLPTNSFTISYTGNVYPHRSSPEILLEALRDLKKESKEGFDFQLIHAGGQSDYWRALVEKFQFSKFFTSMGTVNHSTALSIQQSSNMNLLLTWSDQGTKGILTGKLYEYLLAKKPIFCLINGIQDDEWEKIFADLENSKIFYTKSATNKRAIKEFLKLEYNKWKSNEANIQHIPERFLWQNLFQNFWKEIKRLKS